MSLKCSKPSLIRIYLSLCEHLTCPRYTLTKTNYPNGSITDCIGLSATSYLAILFSVCLFVCFFLRV